jgi:6-pyruvoyltetrahydropterin/6-carboxytetrahydropterin synthase
LAVLKHGFQGQFDSAHHLVGAGICEQTHGHTYAVEACVRLEQGQAEAFEAGLKALLKGYDRRDLNTLMPYPSAENLAEALFLSLKASWPGLVWLRVFEGHGKWAEAHCDDPFLQA